MENLLKSSLIQEVFPGNAPICEKKQPVRAAFSYVDGVCVDNEALGIENDAVTLQQNQVAAGDNGGVATLDHDDDGLTGDIQIPDQPVVPGMVLSQAAYSLMRLIREYWSTKPVEIIPVGMATMSTPRKVLTIPTILPMVVIG